MRDHLANTGTAGHFYRVATEAEELTPTSMSLHSSGSIVVEQSVKDLERSLRLKREKE